MPNFNEVASFASLTENDQNAIKAFYNKATTSSNLVADIRTTFLKTTLAPCSPVIINYTLEMVLNRKLLADQCMPLHQQLAIQDNLMLAYYQLAHQYQTDVNAHKRQDLERILQHMKACADRIGAMSLPMIQSGLMMTTTPSVTQSLQGALKNTWHDFIRAKTKVIGMNMDTSNYWRLYWVWTGIPIRAALNLMSDTFYNITQTKYVTSEYQNALGYISWTLYFARLLMNLGLALKHTIPSLLWMSPEEKALVQAKGFFPQLQDQLNQNKFSIMNDFAWGGINCLTHLRLYGPGMLGYYGNVVTVVLLLGDMSLAFWRYKEECQAHQMEMKRYDDEMASLAQLTGPDIVYHQKELCEARAQCLLDWKHKERGLTVDKAATVANVTAFFILCNCLILDSALSATALTAFSLTGGILLYAIVMVASTVRNHMEVTKASDARLRALLLCEQLLTAPGDTTALYFQSLDEAEFQKKQAIYQHQKFVRSLVLELSIPVVIVLSFTFMPFGGGVAVMAILLVSAILSHYKIESNKPIASPDVVPVDIDEPTALLTLRSDIFNAKPAPFLRSFFHSKEELGECMGGLIPH